jgi:cell shape-determining protein MreC
MWLKGLFKQREGNMNTIAITKADTVVNYTESEVARFIEKAGELSDTKYKVRDFFSELEWESNEATITRSEVNKLLKSIGCDTIRGEYKATITITAYVTGYEADDADDASDCIADDITVDIGSNASISVDNIEVDDVEDDN